MSRTIRTPTERELAELALAAADAGDHREDRVTLEDALRVLDDPLVTTERRDEVLRALNGDPDLYRAWLAGRRATAEDAQTAIDSRTHDHVDTATSSVPPPSRLIGWLRSLIDWPLQTAGATAVLLLAGFTVGHFTVPAQPKEGRLRLIVPDEIPKGAGRAPASTPRVPGSGVGDSTVAAEDETAREGMDYQAVVWLRATRDACSNGPGAGVNLDWTRHRNELAEMAEDIERAAQARPQILPTAPMRQAVEMSSRLAASKDDASIRAALCQKETLYAIQESLTPPGTEQPIG